MNDFKAATVVSRHLLMGADIALPEKWLIHLPVINATMAYSAVCNLLSAKDKPDAIFAVSDSLIPAILGAIKKYQLRIPKDIAVMDFDHIDLVMTMDSPVTRVSQPRFQLGVSVMFVADIEIKENSTPKARSFHCTVLSCFLFSSGSAFFLKKDIRSEKIEL